MTAKRRETHAPLEKPLARRRRNHDTKRLSIDSKTRKRGRQSNILTHLLIFHDCCPHSPKRGLNRRAKGGLQEVADAFGLSFLRSFHQYFYFFPTPVLYS
jgi:hypothetical protein